ncbi:hypothetical protein L596_000766 [Steinernema carpocapsae]|uniref:Uncharacterized protein n=1 Tax=Steinernema carpocapsae TaxID=34508 RepID=A0A4U8UJV5_STECR|nr:hypothetical protein L596_000766 [Steinernema carpocapsae]
MGLESFRLSAGLCLIKEGAAIGFMPTCLKLRRHPELLDFASVGLWIADAVFKSPVLERYIALKGNESKRTLKDDIDMEIYAIPSNLGSQAV